MTKHGSGFCATGKRMFRWEKRDTAKCPRCEEDEDTLHVWKCRGEGVDQVWEKAIAGLNRWMVENKTFPNLADVICDRLSARHTGLNTSVQVSSFLGLRQTVNAQDLVGWRAMLEGLPWLDGQRFSNAISLGSKANIQVGDGCQS